MMHDCNHHRTNTHSFQGDPAQIFTSMDNDKIGPLWTRANLALKFLAYEYLKARAAAHSRAVGGSGENAILARLPGLDAAFPVCASPSEHAPLVEEFLATVTARSLEPPLRRALACCAQRLAAAHRALGRAFPAETRGAVPDVLAHIASFTGARVHDYYEDSGAPLACELADAATLASMTTPEGVDVCPRSEDLGRVVGERLLASSWGQRHFFFDLDEVDADLEGACLRLKSRLNP